MVTRGGQVRRTMKMCLLASRPKDCVPFTLMLPGLLHATKNEETLMALLDSGSSHTCISYCYLPKGIQGHTNALAVSQTLTGRLQGSQEVDLQGVVIPEFFKKRSMEKLAARVFFAACCYDAIIGRDVLNQLGILLDFKEKMMHWDETEVGMWPYMQYG